MRILASLLLALGLACGFAIADNFSHVFNDGDMDGWITLDEPRELLNDIGPSNWMVMASPLNNKALNQTSNIWGDQPDIIPMGTLAIYDLQEWKNLDLTVDIFANDNDCLGLIW